MTVAPTRSRPVSNDRTEALIREARRFQRRRWWGRGLWLWFWPFWC